MDPQSIKVDKIDWWIHKNAGIRQPQPLCPVDHLRLYPQRGPYDTSIYTAHFLKCEECAMPYQLPRGYEKEKQYVLDKIDAKIFKGMKFINLDDEALPIAESKIGKNSEYFVTSLLTKSKVGLRLVAYAGKRGSKEKTQIFVEPEIKRLAFDQTNLHPTDVFSSVEATFFDGTKTKIEKSKEVSRNAKEKAIKSTNP